jgi:hypothetical protein
LLEQGAEETVVLQGSHVGIRKKSAGIFSERAQKARMQVSLLSIGSICRGEMQAFSSTKHCGSWLASSHEMCVT